MSEGLAAIPVEVVRPRMKAREWIAMIVESWVAALIGAALLMLLLGACHHEIDPRIPAFGYLQTLLGLYTLRTLLSAVSPWDAYKLWTREAKPRR